jgi:hypothetical protein
MAQNWKKLVSLSPDEKVILEKRGNLLNLKRRPYSILGSFVLTSIRVIGVSYDIERKGFLLRKKEFLGYGSVQFEIDLGEVDTHHVVNSGYGPILTMNRRPRIYPAEKWDIGFGQEKIQILNELIEIDREISNAISERIKSKTKQ